MTLFVPFLHTWNPGFYNRFEATISFLIPRFPQKKHLQVSTVAKSIPPDRRRLAAGIEADKRRRESLRGKIAGGVDDFNEVLEREGLGGIGCGTGGGNAGGGVGGNAEKDLSQNLHYVNWFFHTNQHNETKNYSYQTKCSQILFFKMHVIHIIQCILISKKLHAV
jgi:hypothetical protein